jgi:DNA replication protein DnaC
MIEIDVHCPIPGAQKVSRIKSFDGVPFCSKHDPKCPVCAEERMREADERRREAQRQAQIDFLKNAARIPHRYRNACFADYITTLPGQKRAVNFCQRYVECAGMKGEPGWGALTGLPGTGKTMLLATMVSALAEQFIRSQYVTQAAMGREFRASYQRGAERSEAQLFDHFSTVPVLFLDELGAGSTEHTDRILFEVLDERYANKLPVVVATNHPMSALESVLGERLFDRMREEATFIAFDWQSARSPAGLRKKAA